MILENKAQEFYYKRIKNKFEKAEKEKFHLDPPLENDLIEPKYPDCKLVLAAIADPQIATLIPVRYSVLKTGIKDFKNAKCKLDAVIMLGDLAENGLSVEYRIIKDLIGSLDTRFISTPGNHDIRLRRIKHSTKRFANFINDLNGDSAHPLNKLCYSEEINGYKIIVLGSDKTSFEKSVLSSQQLSWLDSELDSANGKPAFVLCHQPFKFSHGLPLVWKMFYHTDDMGSVGKQNEQLQEILKKYNNVFYINGHLHSPFNHLTYQKFNGIHSITVPSFTDNKGQTFIIEVYEDKVLFRARECLKGEYVSESELIFEVNCEKTS